MVNRPGILKGLAKRAEKSLKEVDQEAEFSGSSFLAG